MSSAFYPLGMNSYNNRTPQGGYKTWKGRGVFSNPVGITSGNMRPLTNRDPLNCAIYKAGLARPIKHYRRGIAIPVPVDIPIPGENKDNLENYKEAVDYYYSNREVKSSVQDNMVSQMQDQPGGYIVKNNTIDKNGINGQIEDCRTCKGIGIVSGWYPINNLTEKPQPNVTNPLLCCNQQRKARQRVLAPNTLTNRSYYTTTKQYLYNRCNTYTQKSFAYLTAVKAPITATEFLINNPLLGDYTIDTTKPGSPLANFNEYGANCNCNFRIEEAAAQTLFILFIKVLIQEGILPESILKNPSIRTLQELIQYIKTLDVESQKRAELLFLEILNTNSNSNNSAFITGPGEGVRKGCARVYYKPNNYQFAQQGGVDSSTRTLKKKVTTIELNVSQLYGSRFSELYKQKAARCQPSTYWAGGNPKANPKTCFKNSNDVNNNSSSSVSPVYQPNYKILNLNALSSIYK